MSDSRVEAGGGDALPAQVSVVIASFNSESTIRRTLETLQDQEEPGDYEVIVVDSSDDDTVANLVRCFPVARLIRLEQRAYPGKARNIGVAAATGEILAFTDADCVVRRDWIRAIRMAHQTRIPVIGGTIANANPQSWVGWMYFFCKFSHWLPTHEARVMREIPTTTLTMKRWVYDRLGPFLENQYSSDSVFNWSVAEHLDAPLLSPRLEVGHHNYTQVGRVLSKLFQHGRDYAKARVTSEEWSRHRRLLYAVTAAALPVLLFTRTAADVWKSGVYRWQFVAATPLVACGYITWSLGEMVGYATTGGGTWRQPSG